MCTICQVIAVKEGNINFWQVYFGDIIVLDKRRLKLFVHGLVDLGYDICLER